MPNDALNTDALRKDLAACASPETLVAAILKHRPGLRAPVDVEALARDVGIDEIRTVEIPIEIRGAASALLADLAKQRGIISTAPALSPQRRRFAIAHQLGHFLLKEHRGDRTCTPRDLAENRRDTPQRKDEMQANRFAAGLLMPKPLFAAFVEGLGKPAIAHLPVIAAAYDVTLEAAASRYADLTQAMCALLFVKDGVVRSVRPSRAFPALSVRSSDPAPSLPPPAGAKDKVAWLPAEARDWLVLSRDTRAPKLTMQMLGKPGGLQLVMLFINAAAERRADEEAEKQATERPKFGRERTR